MEHVFDLYAESPIRSARWSALTKDRPSPSSLRPIPVKAGQLEHYELRLQAQLHRQSVNLPRCAPALAARSIHRQPRRGPACEPSPPSLLKGRAHPGGAGQYATHPVGALPSLPAGRSAPPAVSAPVPPRPQACQLAEHGRDRDWRATQPMPGSADSMHTTHRVRGGGLGATTQCLARPHQMDVPD